MRSSWDFLLNMLANDYNNLQTKVWSAYHFKYFQNNPILKSRDRTNPPPTSQLWKFTLPPGKVVGSKFFP